MEIRETTSPTQCGDFVETDLRLSEFSELATVDQSLRHNVHQLDLQDDVEIA